MWYQVSLPITKRPKRYHVQHGHSIHPVVIYLQEKIRFDITFLQDFTLNSFLTISQFWKNRFLKKEFLNILVIF